jgi:hypothetical protein
LIPGTMKRSRRAINRRKRARAMRLPHIGQILCPRVDQTLTNM